MIQNIITLEIVFRAKCRFKGIWVPVNKLKKIVIGAWPVELDMYTLLFFDLQFCYCIITDTSPI